MVRVETSTAAAPAGGGDAEAGGLGAGSMRQRAVYWAAMAVVAALPFAIIPPLLATPWVGLTDDKLLLLVLVVAWVMLGRQALPTRTEWRLLAPTLAFIGVAVVSARFAAADYAPEAVRYIVRLLAAAFVLLVALRLNRDASRGRGLLWAVAVGAGASALLGLGEALRIQALGPLLDLFKIAPTRVGGELRVSASFQYATIAAMYFEMVAPLAVVLAATSTRRWQQLLGVAIAVVCTANVVLSLTRTGMLTLIAVYAVLLAAALRENWRRLALPSLASAAALLGGTGLLLLKNPVFDLRLMTESDADWYGAAYQAPASLQLQPNKPSMVDLEVRNEGRITWTSSGNHPFALGYRWLTEDGNGVLDIPPAEVQLSHDVEPGETIHIRAALEVPNLPAGTYRIDWGMLQRDVLQFYERGWTDAETRVVMDGPTGARMPTVVPREDGEAPWVVGRLDLWGAALKLIAAHPVVGLGPDNFRHYYGAELGLEGWDERIQANNLYLEILADLGVVGLAAFGWVVFGPLRSVAKGVRFGDPIALGVALAMGAFLLHGLLDAFLAFTPTAVLFWLLLGLAQKPQVSGR
jgi:O-Antigen ligase